MISKDLRVPVPIYVKKYFEREFGVDEAGRVFADKASVLGKVVNAMLIDFPHEIEYKKVSGSCLTIRYIYRSKTSCVPSWKKKCRSRVTTRWRFAPKTATARTGSARSGR